MAFLKKTTEDPFKEYFASPDESEGGSGAIRSYVESYRSMQPGERSYVHRRLAVIFFGCLTPFVILFVIATVKDWLSGGQSEATRVFEGPFDVQITNVRSSSLLPGSAPELLISVQRRGSSEWSPSLQCPLRDAGSVEDAYVEFVSGQVAFVTTGKLYAVTTDGGISWSARHVYDFGSADLSRKSDHAALAIDGVTLDEWGAGALFPQGVASADSAFTTDDFGLTWRRNLVTRGKYSDYSVDDADTATAIETTLSQNVESSR